MSAGNLLAANKNRQNIVSGGNGGLKQTQLSSMPSSLGHTAHHQSGIPISPNISTSMMPNAAGTVTLPSPAPISLPSQQQQQQQHNASTSNSNAMLSSRHLPFPYNMNNFHHTGY